MMITNDQSNFDPLGVCRDAAAHLKPVRNKIHPTLYLVNIIDSLLGNCLQSQRVVEREEKEQPKWRAEGSSDASGFHYFIIPFLPIFRTS